MAFHTAEALGEGLGVAMFAAGADFRAATDWVPCGVRPFDRRINSHVIRSSGLEIEAPLTSRLDFGGFAPKSGSQWMPAGKGHEVQGEILIVADIDFPVPNRSISNCT
jgi:hypothetical protein